LTLSGQLGDVIEKRSAMTALSLLLKSKAETLGSIIEI